MRKISIKWQSDHEVPGLGSLTTEYGADAISRIDEILQHIRDFVLLRIHGPRSRGVNGSGNIEAFLRGLEKHHGCNVHMRFSLPLGRESAPCQCHIDIHCPEDEVEKVRSDLEHIVWQHETFDQYYYRRRAQSDQDALPTGEQ